MRVASEGILKKAVHGLLQLAWPRASSTVPGTRRQPTEVRRRLLRAGLAGAAAWVLPVLAAAEPELRVFTLKHRLPEELAPALRPLLGPGESISSFNGKLVVRATPATLGQIERVLAEIDTVRRNLRISVRHADAREASELTQGASGSIHHDGTRVIVTGGRNGDGGLVAGRAGPEGEVQVHAERRTTTARDALTQTLTVMDGAQGYLQVGESIPVVQPFLALVGPRLPVAVGIDFYDVTTGFAVSPRLQGDRVQLSISPRLSFRSSQGMQLVEMRELATTVTVRLGEWFDLGGVVESANDVNRQILATRRRDSRGDTRMLVRVD